ncbi:MAG: hypothetical protein IJ189_03235 [Clostridia bacterium]|nr:hypothetical protein [Clostridia bacterium]
MYKLLLVTDREDIQSLFQDQLDWKKTSFRPPFIAATAQEGIDLLNSRAIDAVGYLLPQDDAMPLKRFLRYGRPSLPIYAVCENAAEQEKVLKELTGVLDRLHADFADDYYDEEAMLTIQRDELVHALLAGELKDWEALKRSFKMIRSHVSLDHPSILYEIDMPQGEVYLARHSGHAQQRLESALRNNFFGRYVEGIYYAVAVLTPRHIRVVCLPMHGKEPESIDALGALTDAHIRDSIQKIKEYLGLDLTVTQSAWLDSVQDLLCPEQPE